jgi:hypothetical protein
MAINAGRRDVNVEEGKDERKVCIEAQSGQNGGFLEGDAMF